MVASSHFNTRVKEIGYQPCPPPVKPATQETEFAPGDALLVEFDGQEHVIVVDRARVCEHQVRPDLTVRWVLYTIHFHDPKTGEFLRHARVLGEKALLRAFRAYIWWLP